VNKAERIERELVFEDQVSKSLDQNIQGLVHDIKPSKEESEEALFSSVLRKSDEDMQEQVKGQGEPEQRFPFSAPNPNPIFPIY